jgi:hypothetical protein
MILMLPVEEMRMFSIFRSAGRKEEDQDQFGSLKRSGRRSSVLTSVDDRILMAVLQRAPDLPRELPRGPLPQSAMTDDVVEHLPSAHVLGDHVEVVGVGKHLGHAADVRMMEDGRDGGLSYGPDLFRAFSGDGFLDKGLGWRERGGEEGAVGSKSRLGFGRVAVRGFGYSGDDFDSDLDTRPACDQLTAGPTEQVRV